MRCLVTGADHFSPAFKLCIIKRFPFKSNRYTFMFPPFAKNSKCLFSCDTDQNPCLVSVPAPMSVASADEDDLYAAADESCGAVDEEDVWIRPPSVMGDFVSVRIFTGSGFAGLNVM